MGKFVWEVDELPSAELTYWLAFFKLEHERIEREKAKGKDTDSED